MNIVKFVWPVNMTGNSPNLYAETAEERDGGKNINILYFRLVNIVNE